MVESVVSLGVEGQTGWSQSNFTDKFQSKIPVDVTVLKKINDGGDVYLGYY